VSHTRRSTSVRAGGRALGVAAGVVLALAFMDVPGGAEDQRFVHERWVRVEGPGGEPQRVYVVFPFRNDRKDHPEGERYPLVVALHGRGETEKGPIRGPRGWVLDYELPEAYGALQRGQVTQADYRGLVDDVHLAAVNAELAARAFEGAMVVAPYVPDLSRKGAQTSVEAYTRGSPAPCSSRCGMSFRGRRAGGGASGSTACPSGAGSPSRRGWPIPRSSDRWGASSRPSAGGRWRWPSGRPRHGGTGRSNTCAC
jgi:hypothetical protein